LNSTSEKPETAPASRKRATIALAIGGYTNTAILIVQGLLLIPLFLHFLGAHLYGIWMASGGILGMLGVLNFGVGNMLIQRVANAYGQKEFSKVGAYFINGMIVYLIITFIFIIIGLLLSFFFLEILTVPSEVNSQLRGCFQIAVIAAGAGIINECLRGFAQALLRPVFSMIAIAASRILGIVITVLLLYKNAGLWAIPLGMLVTEAFILIATLIQSVTLYRELHIKAKVTIDWLIVKEYFHQGGAIFMAKLGSALSRESDPLMIAYFLRPELTTVYMLTRKAADIVFQMLAILYGASHSAFSHLVGNGNQEKITEISTKLVMIVFLLGLIGFVPYVMMNHTFVTLWVGETFVLNQTIILMIGIAFFVSSLRNVVWQLLNGYGDYQFSSRIIFIEGLVKVLLAVILLNYFGILGVPLAMVVTSILATALLSIKLQSHLKLVIDVRSIVYAFAITAILFFISGYAGGMVYAASWMKFALFSGLTVMCTTMLCMVSNWTKVKILIKDYL
jgi:O-antigen/teichoic acid export membrane protein